MTTYQFVWTVDGEAAFGGLHRFAQARRHEAEGDARVGKLHVLDINTAGELIVRPVELVESAADFIDYRVVTLAVNDPRLPAEETTYTVDLRS
jgi:hypothetical protein